MVHLIFKFGIWQFLDAREKHVCTKKVKLPLIHGSKIVCVEIHNKILLFDSFAFMTAALIKFPAIFNIKEEKKGFFHLRSTIQNFGFIEDLCHTAIITSLILFHLLKEQNF